MKATEDEIIHELGLLDSAFPEYRFLSDAQKELRKETAIDALSEFPAVVIREARIGIARNGPTSLPPIPLVFRTCQDIENEMADKGTPIPYVSQRELVAHNCSEPPELNQAFSWTSMVSEYEAEHARCEGEILATRPVCGNHYGPIISPLLGGVMKRFPEQTKDWNPFHKGFLLCQECEPKSEKTIPKVSLIA